jgi:hypothetical protein
MSHSKPIQDAAQAGVRPHFEAAIADPKRAADLAAAIGWTAPSLKAMRRNRTRWGVDLAARIAVALGLAVRIDIRRSGTTVTVGRDEELDHDAVTEMAARASEL